MNKVKEDACNLPNTVFSIRDLYPFLENVYNLAPGKILIYLILIRILTLFSKNQGSSVNFIIIYF